MTDELARARAELASLQVSFREHFCELSKPQSEAMLADMRYLQRRIDALQNIKRDQQWAERFNR